MTMSELGFLLVAALLGGAVNALAGGGSLITFPALIVAGVPPTIANATNTVALSPGYLSGTLSQRRDLAGQRDHLVVLAPTSVLGGIAGGWLLLATDEGVFEVLVPFLILGASLLLAAQARVKPWIARQLSERRPERRDDVWLEAVLVFLASVYGGYFGAGLGIVLLAVIGISGINKSLARMNALKQAISLCVNTAAAAYFVWSAEIVWSATIAMAVGAIAGGWAGGRLATRVEERRLRAIVVGLGIVISVTFFARLFVG